MRILFWIVACFIIFYLGMQTATIHQDREVIQDEKDLTESYSSTNEISFSDKNESIITHQDEPQRSGIFYSLAVFLESFFKSFFSIVFQFLYRFSSMFF